MRGTEIVTVARRWIGTPYRHQASQIGAGADCLGLLRGVWREVCGQEPTRIPAYTQDWSEPPGDEALWRAACRHLVEAPRDEHRAGGVVLFRMHPRAVAKHLGIAATREGGETFIHAYDRHGVVENSLSAPWARRIVARFEFPERRV